MMRCVRRTVARLAAVGVLALGACSDGGRTLEFVNTCDASVEVELFGLLNGEIEPPDGVPPEDSVAIPPLTESRIGIPNSARYFVSVASGRQTEVVEADGEDHVITVELNLCSSIAP